VCCYSRSLALVLKAPVKAGAFRPKKQKYLLNLGMAVACRRLVTCQVAVHRVMAARRSGLGAAAAHVEIVDSGTTDEAGGGGRRQERGAGGDRSLVGRRCARRWRSVDEPTVADAGREVRRPLRRQMVARLRRRRAAPSRQQGAGSRGPLDAWTGVWRRRRSGPAVRLSGSGVSHSQPLRCGGGYREWRPGRWAAAGCGYRCLG